MQNIIIQVSKNSSPRKLERHDNNDEIIKRRMNVLKMIDDEEGKIITNQGKYASQYLLYIIDEARKLK